MHWVADSVNTIGKWQRKVDGLLIFFFFLNESMQCSNQSYIISFVYIFFWWNIRLIYIYYLSNLSKGEKRFLIERIYQIKFRWIICTCCASWYQKAISIITISTPECYLLFVTEGASMLHRYLSKLSASLPFIIYYGTMTEILSLAL